MIPESWVIHQTKPCLHYEKYINVNVQKAKNKVSKNWFYIIVRYMPKTKKIKRIVPYFIITKTTKNDEDD